MQSLFQKRAEVVNGPNIKEAEDQFSGIIRYPVGSVENADVTDPSKQTYAQAATSALQATPVEQRGGLGTPRVPRAPVTTSYQPSLRPLYAEDDPTYLQYKDMGLDLNDPKIHNLFGTNVDFYKSERGAYPAYLDDYASIRWGLGMRPATDADTTAQFAHEVVHSLIKGHNVDIPDDQIKVTHPDDDTINYYYPRSYGDWYSDKKYKSDRQARFLKDGWLTTGNDFWKPNYYIHEFPAIVNEWTYGQPSGMIHPEMVKSKVTGKSVPLRNFTGFRAIPFTGSVGTDPYLDNLFPLVDAKKLQSNPRQEYVYWNSGKEGDSIEGPKRIIYDTPTGWWVTPTGKYERTGGDLISPTFYFRDNTPLSKLPPNLQRHIQNMTILNANEPYSEEREIARRKNQELARDMLAPLGLRRKFPFGKHQDLTLGEMIARKQDSKLNGNTASADIDEGYAVSPSSLPVQSWSHLAGPSWTDTDLWDPNRVIEPIPIGLADLQKKYSITPTLTEDSDFRSPEQYQQIIDDAQHCYDFQDYLNKYWNQGGGHWGS